MWAYLFLVFIVPASSVKAVGQPEADAIAISSEGVLTAKGHKNAADLPPFRQATNGSTPTGWIQIGTPKKWLYTIFDTGSDKLVAKTWESIQAELASIDQGVDGMVVPSDAIYNHATSSSYQQKFMQDHANKTVPKMSSITYGSGTAITNDGTETVLVGNRSLSNYTIMEITADSLQLLHTSKGIAGVLGMQHMKNKSLGRSLFSMMREDGSLTSFGYCRGTGNNGTFIWGDKSTEGHEMDVVGDMHWAVKLGAVKVAVGANKTSSLLAKRAAKHVKSHKDAPWDEASSGQDAQADGDASGAFGGDDAQEEQSDPAADQETLKDTCTDNSCCAILDTGSNIIAGPTAVMKAITDLVDVKPDCSNFDKLPNITMTFGGLPVTIPASGYVMKVPMPTGGMGGEGGEGGGEGETQQQGGDDSGALQAGLAQKRALSARAATRKKWEFVFERLNKNYGIDLRDMVNQLLKQQNDTTSPEFMCMPALVPLDKHTKYGPLYVVGTPLLDAYYARWSFAKNDPSPKIHLMALENATVCQDTEAHVSEGAPAAPKKESSKGTSDVLMRKEKVATTPQASTPKVLSVQNRGPTERLPEEIRFPHWAKDLLHV